MDILVCPELRVQTGATRYRAPDVAIPDAALPPEPIATRPPLAVFEVLSPEDRIQRMKRKFDEYRQMGIVALWVIDPEIGGFERYMEGQLVRQSEFSLPERGIAFPVKEIAGLVR